MASTVNIYEAKTHFSKPVEKAERGEEVIVARAGKPAVRIVAYRAPKPRKHELGFLAGKG